MADEPPEDTPDAEPETEPEAASPQDGGPDAAEAPPDPTEMDREALEERVTALREEVRDLEAALEEAREEAEDHLERARRVKADFDNYRKRKADQVEQARRQARDDLLEDLVDVLDSFDRALEQADDEAARQGIRMIRKQFMGVLESEGVTRLEPEGEPFDPLQQEAVLREATDEADEGTVLEVLEPGYVRGDETLRPARVKVAAAPEAEAGDGA